MAIAVVQSNFATAASGLTCSGTLGNTTTGHTVVVVSCAYNGTTLPTISGVSISPGAGTFAKVGGQVGSLGNYGSIEVWAAPNITGGTAANVTVTYTTASTSASDVYFIELSGAPTTIAIDGGASNGKAGTANTACSSSAITTTNASDFIVAAFSPGGAMSSGQAGWTFLSVGTQTGVGVEYIVETATQSGLVATATQSGSFIYGAYIVAFANTATGATPVNATVAIAAKAVSGLTVTPLVTKDATFFCSAGVHAATFKCNLGIFGHAILQGKATSTSFNGQNTQLQGVLIKPHATGTFTAKVTHNAIVSILGNAGNSRFGPVAAPTIVNAIVHLFGFAANNTPINQFLGRAFLTLRAIVPVDQVSINGRATLTLVPRVAGNLTFAARGRAQVTATGLVTGAGNVTATLVINGRAAFTAVNPFLIHEAQVVIQAGNPIFTFVEGQAALMGHARMTLSPFITRATQVQIRGRATLVPNVTLGGTNNIFGGVHFAGRAIGTFFIPPQPLNAVAAINGTATLTLPATNIVSLSATVAIRGRANAPFMAIVQGGIFQNGVLNIRGQAVVTASQFTLVQPTVAISGLANLQLFPGGTLRAILGIHGFAALTAQVAKNPIQWSSSNTLQYKVWQYNTESMVRVLGSSWTATSVGLSFQAVAMEVVSTEAGWGS